MALSEKQLEAIELFATGDKNCSEVAEIVEVARNTISNWRKDTEFTSECVARARALLKDHLPKVYKVLVEKAEEGSIHHIRVLLEHIDNVERLNLDANKGNVSFSWNL